MKVAVITICLLLVVIVVGLFWLGYMSRSGTPPGLQAERLAACPGTPNCVCSEEDSSSSAFVNAIEIADYETEEAWQALKRAVTEAGGQVQMETRSYMAVTFSSTFFGFVDDLELRLDAEHRLIHVRSASRVGHSDFGVNSDRVERLRSRFESQF